LRRMTEWFLINTKLVESTCKIEARKKHLPPKNEFGGQNALIAPRATKPWGKWGAGKGGVPREAGRSH